MTTTASYLDIDGDYVLLNRKTKVEIPVLVKDGSLQACWLPPTEPPIPLRKTYTSDLLTSLWAPISFECHGREFFEWLERTFKYTTLSSCNSLHVLSAVMWLYHMWNLSKRRITIVQEIYDCIVCMEQEFKAGWTQKNKPYNFLYYSTDAQIIFSVVEMLHFGHGTVDEGKIPQAMRNVVQTVTESVIPQTPTEATIGDDLELINIACGYLRPERNKKRDLGV